jgi:hypothetical protein
MLDRVHAAFSAEELAGVELVLQNPEAALPKTPTGRALERPDKLAQNRSRNSEALDSGTIACVSGFLVNMVERTIRLISPTRTSERWLRGYRVYGERRFASAVEFGGAIEDLIEEHMETAVGAGGRLRFRQDLGYERKPDGFELHCRGGRVALAGFAGAGLLGDLLHAGRNSAGEITAELASAGTDVFVAADLLQQLYDRGLFDEDQP